MTLRGMKKDLTEFSNPLETLKDKWEYYVSITSYKKGNYEYFNLCLSGVVKNNSKSIGLGREESIKKHLSEYCKSDKKKVSSIKKDWKGFIKSELYSTGSSVRVRLMNTIKKNPVGFKKLKITKDILFPIK